MFRFAIAAVGNVQHIVEHRLEPFPQGILEQSTVVHIAPLDPWPSFGRDSMQAAAL